MKLLIIGKTGQLGSHLITNAGNSGYRIIAPSKNDFDISDKDKFKQLLAEHIPDAVINTAAFHNTRICEEQPLKAFKYNCIAIKNMAEISNDLNVQFITFSTDYVFDGKRDIPYDEYETPNPIQMYGLSKLAGEFAALSYEASTVIRTCGLYGLQGATSKNGNFVDNIIKESLQSNRIGVSDDQTVSPTYAGDLSKAVLQLVAHEKLKEYSLYHLVNEGYCTWYQFAEEIFRILNIDTELVPINRKGLDKDGKMRRPRVSALRNRNARELGIQLPSWKDALQRYLNLKYKDK